MGSWCPLASAQLSLSPAASQAVEASRAAPGKSGLHARGEGERVLALESREGVSGGALGLSPGSHPKLDHTQVCGFAAGDTAEVCGGASWPGYARPDSPGEPGMQPRDPCLPWRGKLGPGHTLR